MNMRIAMGLKKNMGRESNIVALGAAQVIAVYDSENNTVEILNRKDCEDCISAMSSLDIVVLSNIIKVL